MKKYYIELATNSGDIILQSKWYETEQEALKQAEDIHYKVEKRKLEYV